MAIEVRELVIKATVNEKKGKRKDKNENSEKEEIIRECVDKIMEMLKYEKDR